MRVTLRSIAGLLLIAPLGGCTDPVHISGSVDSVDGDSFRIGAAEIRLHAIDAPEGRQTCRRNGAAWRCGDAAARKLAELVRGREVTCEQRDVDNYGRIVARCSNGSVDLGSAMVAAGLALAYRRYGDDYVGEEDDARAAKLGVWAGEFTAPWEWRQSGERSSAQSESASVAAEDCYIKGNINRRGERIYHVVGSESYDETRIDEQAGERWFCSVAEAERAGWRAPRRPR